MELKLVDPNFIKRPPGRKSDVKDAQWIAECQLKNLIKGSFVPEPIVQDMRKLNRQIINKYGSETIKATITGKFSYTDLINYQWYDLNQTIILGFCGSRFP